MKEEWLRQYEFAKLTVEALTFEGDGNIDHLEQFLTRLKPGENYPISEIDFNNKNEEEINDLIWRLKKLGEVFEPMRGILQRI